MKRLEMKHFTKITSKARLMKTGRKVTKAKEKSNEGQGVKWTNYLGNNAFRLRFCCFRIKVSLWWLHTHRTWTLAWRFFLYFFGIMFRWNFRVWGNLTHLVSLTARKNQVHATSQNCYSELVNISLPVKSTRLCVRQDSVNTSGAPVMHLNFLRNSLSTAQQQFRTTIPPAEKELLALAFVKQMRICEWAWFFVQNFGQ